MRDDRSEARAKRRPLPQPKSSAPHLLTCRVPDVEFDNITSTKMFKTLNAVRAQRAELPTRGEDIVYNKADLYAIAEIGYEYLRCGGYRLAEVIFKGLVALDPEEAYFAFALGH